MNENKTNINFFPGHMNKARREIEEKIKLIDIVYEVVDARMPASSRIKDIDDLIKNKPKIMIMTKRDLCDLDKTNKWISYYESYKQKYEDLKEYGITLSDEYYVSGFISTEQGTAEIIEKDGKYVLKLTGIKNATYKFGIASEDDKQIMFEYYFDDNGKLELEQVNKFN